MAITVTALKEEDIPGAITAIQVAFADDPYNLWVYSDRENVINTPIDTHIELCHPH